MKVWLEKSSFVAAAIFTASTWHGHVASADLHHRGRNRNRGEWRCSCNRDPFSSHLHLMRSDSATTSRKAEKSSAFDTTLDAFGREELEAMFRK